VPNLNMKMVSRLEQVGRYPYKDFVNSKKLLKKWGKGCDLKAPEGTRTGGAWVWIIFVLTVMASRGRVWGEKSYGSR